MNIETCKKLIVIVCICLLSGIILSGCSDKNIKFYRESAVKHVLDEVKEENTHKDTIKKSSGIIIYKDNSYQDNSVNKKSIRFGPKDPDFDIKFRF